MNRQFFIVITVVVLALVGVFALNSKKDGGNDGKVTDAQPSSHITGAKESKVTLIEYGDFQCPACKSYHPLLLQLKADYGDKVAFQFRHFPLVQIHPNAFIGSRAAEAAGKQGKFFEMHDLLYENQDSWSQSTNPTAILEGYAQQLGLNLEQYKKDANSPEVAATINADAKAAQSIGGNSTPTFVLNGRKLDPNPKSAEEFKKLLDEEIAKN